MNIMIVTFGKLINSAGGGERVFVNMANQFRARGHEVSAFCWDDEAGMPFYQLDKNIYFKNLNERETPITVPKYIKLKREFLRFIGALKNNNNPALEWLNEYRKEFIKKAIELRNPDLIITYDSQSSVILKNMLKVKIPVIAMFHMSLQQISESISEKERLAYSQMEMIQVLLPSDIAVARKLFNAPVICIGNEIMQCKAPVDLSKEKSVYTIVSVGRLDRVQKRTHLLIQAFGLLKDKYSNWEVEIWGDADQKNSYGAGELDKLIKENGSGRIRLCGVTKDIASVLSSADIFAFPSAFEGFSLALGEAMSIGLPAVGYRSSPSVNEMIEDGESGFLCEDGIEPFAEKLELLMKDQELRVRMGQTAHAAMKKYSSESIWEQWNSLVLRIGSKKHDK